MVWSTKKCVIVASVIGSGLIIIGAVMIPVLKYIIKKKVESVSTGFAFFLFLISHVLVFFSCRYSIFFQPLVMRWLNGLI